MQKITTTLQQVGGALVALIIAPIVALFGLTILGLAIGAAALMTGTITAMVWQRGRETETTSADRETPANAELQRA